MGAGIVQCSQEEAFSVVRRRRLAMSLPLARHSREKKTRDDRSMFPGVFPEMIEGEEKPERWGREAEMIGTSRIEGEEKPERWGREAEMIGRCSRDKKTQRWGREAEMIGRCSRDKKTRDDSSKFIPEESSCPSWIDRIEGEENRRGREARTMGKRSPNDGEEKPDRWH
ncbi:hypothetical protein R1sor_026870 [Riccia sorocarpa]|uniref:Uncharacterized protein n=1 Tax=Riccia sorocarpa TaxID=122646 RepID=A0ABD3GCL5_9MARC